MGALGDGLGGGVRDAPDLGGGRLAHGAHVQQLAPRPAMPVRRCVQHRRHIICRPEDPGQHGLRARRLGVLCIRHAVLHCRLRLRHAAASLQCSTRQTCVRKCGLRPLQGSGANIGDIVTCLLTSRRLLPAPAQRVRPATRRQSGRSPHQTATTLWTTAHRSWSPPSPRRHLQQVLDGSDDHVYEQRSPAPDTQDLLDDNRLQLDQKRRTAVGDVQQELRPDGAAGRGQRPEVVHLRH